MDLRKDLPLLTFALMTAFTLKAGAVSRVVPASYVQKANIQAVTTAQFKSYREWKNDQIQDAQGKVAGVKLQIEQKKQARQAAGAGGTDPNLAMRRGGSDTDAGLEKQLMKEQFDLDVAQDLSVTDYFVGYLTKVSDKKSAINEVAGKLSPEEVAELMTAYANSVFGSHGSDLPSSAGNFSKDAVK